jgi:hypothetical protein
MAVNVVQNALSSRRLNRWLPWIAGAVLAAGVIAFLVAYFGNTADSKESFGSAPAQTFSAQREVPLEPAARATAAKFIATAVARRNLDQAWALATENVKGGLSYKEWMSGDIRVPPLGAPIDRAAITKIVYSHPRDAELNIVVLPKPNKYKITTTLYVVDLKKVGSRWLVDYCQVQSSAGAPAPS